ncbi:hypothetical protein FZC33_01905 [Labrys sp. KNU-23]|uniref:hypothetical protein n=1 Tax=Labrys sp. KNU-23 TaxID=2789216 RepID=UPI0011EF11A6|nr:hypothetical protein [Labrys sp. KNU-23]QEN85040.1 hypothetical protein FZC33_01905 [Labrys sp. KNU-23]
MDDNQDELLLAYYRKWAVDAGIPKRLINMVEKVAREDHKLYPDQSISGMFYGLVRHLVAPNAPWSGHA